MAIHLKAVPVLQFSISRNQNYPFFNCGVAVPKIEEKSEVYYCEEADLSSTKQRDKKVHFLPSHLIQKA